MRFEDLPQVRAAVLKYVGTRLGPRDRAALFTTSGQQGVDFTDRAEALSEALNKVSPSPIAAPGFSSIGDAYVSYFQAVQVDQQVGLQPSESDISKCLALRVAVQEFGDFHTATQAIRDAYTSGLQESRATLATLRIVVQRMAATPGQRSVLLVSPGFFVPSDLRNESDQLMALAIRSKVLISAVDARGVWTNSAFSASKRGASAASIRDEVAFRDLEGQANTDELIALAEDTGGAVNLNNDFFGGVEKGAAPPEYMYLLGFVPQNLKLDGSFHALKVMVAGGEKLSSQARRGYWAPKHPEDEAAVSKQEIENAVFSRDEIHNLPVDMHTQLTKTGEQAKLNVLTSVDLKSIHLRKAEDRNRNDLRIVATLFDTNGNFLVGTEKLVQLRLRDETVARLDQKPPVVIRTDFDVKAGVYLVRLVVRDAEGQQITAENAAVEVP
jgi:VWFA-related protein